MVNHMEEVAKMLGVEFGEKFKIVFADGRVAIARNGAEMLKILSMNANITSIECKADSLALNVAFSDGAASEINWKNSDLGEKFVLKSDGLTLDDVTKIAVCFMDTGEKAADYAWEKA